MAWARGRGIVVEKRVNVPEDEFTLVLTQDEAETLLVVTNLVGGAPAGRRGFVDQISRALEGAGVNALGDVDVIGNSLSGDERGAIYFGEEITR